MKAFNFFVAAVMAGTLAGAQTPGTTASRHLTLATPVVTNAWQAVESRVNAAVIGKADASAVTALSNYIARLVADVAPPSSPNLYIRDGVWVAYYEPFLSSLMVTNAVVITNNHKITTHYTVSAMTDGKAVMRAQTAIEQKEIPLVSAEVVSGAIAANGLIVSPIVQGASVDGVVRVKAAGGESKTINVYLSRSIEMKQIFDIYTADMPLTLRAMENLYSLNWITADGGETITKSAFDNSGWTHTFGVNTYFTTGAKAWNPECIFGSATPAMCSFILFKGGEKSLASYAQGGHATNSNFGPAFVLGKRLIASSEHYGGDMPATYEVMRPDGTVVMLTFAGDGTWWRLSDWVRDNYGAAAEEVLGSVPGDYADLRIYETPEEIPDDCVPYLASFDTLRAYFDTLDVNGREVLDFGGVCGWSIAQANCVYPVQIINDRTYNSYSDSLRDDLKAAKAQGGFWRCEGGDSSRPVFMLLYPMDDEIYHPLVIGLWTTRGGGPSICRAVRALEAFERARGRNPAISLKVATPNKLNNFIYR